MTRRRPNLVGRPVHARSTSDTPLPQPEPAREDLGPLVGRTFGGYEIVSYIGEGPSGAVYRGEDLLGNAMAVKVLHAGLANRPRTEQLRRELERLSALDHAQLQRIYDAGYGEEGQFFYVTDELIGCDLETGLDDSGGLAPRKSYEIVRSVCHALEAAHAAGVVHGGLRPRNVFLMPQDHGTAVKVLDFGAARLGGGSDRGIVAGHPVYLAPEQMTGPMDGAATARSDLYSLGVLMHELFCGVVPAFRGGQASALAGRRGPVVPPPNVDAQLGRLIVSLLDMEPARRLPSATAVLSELERWTRNAGAQLDPHQPAVTRRSPSAAAGSIGPDSTMRMTKFDALSLAQETMPSAGGRTQDQDLATGPNLLQDDVAGSDVEGEGIELAGEPTSTNARTSELATRGRKTMTQNSTPKPDSPAAHDNAADSVEASLEDFISQANASFPAADGWDLHTGDVELIEADEGPAVAAARPSAMRHPDRTEVVSQPLPAPYAPMYAAPAQAAPGTNPLMVAGLTVVAVAVGAVLAFYFLRSMAPQQQPAPQVIVTPAPAAPVAAAPVVTPLPAPAAAASVVTPLPSAAPVAHVAAPEAVVVHHAAAKKHVGAAPAAAPKSAPKAAAPKSDVSKKDAAKKSGNDWVDPFAN